MTVREAEKDATDLLRNAWWDGESESRPLPVDPMLLAEDLGIEVREELLPPDESGSIFIPPTGTVVIKLNVFDHPNRQRFTCAHELGHYTRRRKKPKVLQAKTFVDYRNTLAGAGIDREEIYANQFAAALLMPAHLVQRFAVHERWPLEKMAREFGTSTQALGLRLRNLNLRVP